MQVNKFKFQSRNINKNILKIKFQNVNWDVDYSESNKIISKFIYRLTEIFEEEIAKRKEDIGS